MGPHYRDFKGVVHLPEKGDLDDVDEHEGVTACGQIVFFPGHHATMATWARVFTGEMTNDHPTCITCLGTP